MTETDYQNECIRAELFDLPVPSREEFFSRPRENAAEGKEEEEEDEEEVTAEQVEVDAGVRREGIRRIGGGLDELNSILSSTQKKLNRFKTFYGSFSNLLKIKMGAKKEGEEGETEKQVDPATDSGSGEKNDGEEKVVSESAPVAVNKGGDSQLDQLDSLINKAERAELSLLRQNKQMKKFLN